MAVAQYLAALSLKSNFHKKEYYQNHAYTMGITGQTDMYLVNSYR